MDSLAVRLEAVLGRLDKGAQAPAKTPTQRMEEAVARLEMLLEQGTRVSSAALGAPRLELETWGAKENRKWVVENQVCQLDLTIPNPTPKQTVYIFGCLECTIRIPGKVRAVTMDKCTKVTVILEGAVGSCEVVHCSSAQVQFQGSAGSVSIYNTAGCKLYLGSAAAASETEVTTSKSSDVNVVAPGGTEEADEVEYLVPNQLVTKFDGTKFVTAPVALA